MCKVQQLKKITPGQFVLFSLVILTYGLLFYHLLHLQFRLDFTSFYTSSLAYISGINPYDNLIPSFLATTEKIPANLNPPLFLLIIKPLTWLPFHIASLVWTIVSLTSGLLGALIIYLLIFPEDKGKKNKIIFLSLYLLLYFTIINTTVGQVGGVLLLFIMAGYYFYLKKHDYCPGILWGFIVAIKFFPALLVFLALSQKRYKVIGIMGITALIAWLIPFITDGLGIYSHYFNMVPLVLWYGANWNGSFYGFLFRLLVEYSDTYPNLLFVDIAYGIFFLSSFIWYFKKINRVNDKPDDHRAFCLTLVMMLLMSPFAWIYYFSLLIMPLTLSWKYLDRSIPAYERPSSLWIICFFLINFPSACFRSSHMGSIFYKLSFYSCYFYGLLLLAFLLGRLFEIKTKPSPLDKTSPYLSYPINNIISFGLFVPLVSFILHLIK